MSEESSVLRIMGFLVLALVGTGGILFLDFTRVVKEADAAEAPPPSFQAYLETVPKKLASLTAATRASAKVMPLDAMLPRAPEDWTMRALVKGGADVEGFLPRPGDTADAAAVNLVSAVGASRVDAGATVAVQVYERGERRVIVQLVRHPDEIFTGSGAIDRRHALQRQAAELRGRAFLTVRGLDVTEEFPGDGMRLRLFSATVGGQIEVRLLASRRLKDVDLVPFFESMDVQAMNASVVDRQPGLGEIPVLVLASGLSESDRAAYDADRAARARAAGLRADALRDEARAAVAASADAENAGPTPAPKPGLSTTECRSEAGVKRCSVTSGG